MEVFIGYTDSIPVAKLRDTLLVWEAAGFEPVAIRVKDLTSNMVRIAAEGLAHDDYIVAGIGSKPGVSKNVVIYKKGEGIKVTPCSPTS